MPPDRRVRGRGPSLRSPVALVLLALAFAWVPSARASVDAAQGLAVAVISDLNGRYGSTEYESSVDEAVRLLLDLQPDLVVSTGDMVAGQKPGGFPPGVLTAMWEAFHRHVTEPLRAAGIAFAVTPGNHDGSAYPAFAAERKRFGQEWAQRRPPLRFVDAGGYPYQYAFELDEVLFISLDVTVTRGLSSAGLAWLERLLAATSDRYAFRVVFSHVPVWPVAAGRARESTRDQRLHALLARERVDLYLSGHHHAFYPGVVDGVGYISQACLGAAPRRLLGDSARSHRSVTLIRFRGEEIDVAALLADGSRRLLDWQSLPQRIDAGPVTMYRADLIPGSVGPLLHVPELLPAPRPDR